MMEARKIVLLRIYLMFFIMVVFGLIILSKVFTLQLVERNYWISKEKEINLKYKPIEAMRGNIYSSDSSLLSTSVPVFDLYMDVISDPITDEIFQAKVDSLGRSLSRELGNKTPQEWSRVLRRARTKKNRYLPIAKRIDYPSLKRIRTFPIFRMGKYRGGLIVEEHDRREAPFKSLAQRTIGYARPGLKPIGIEGAYHELLSGKTGKRLMQRISGDVWRPVNYENEIDPVPGCDVYSSIHGDIQDVAHHALEKQLIAQNADHGCVALMEVKTGKIRAAVNLTRTDTGVYRERINYLIWEANEPGSTFKLPSLMAPIEDGMASPEDLVDTEGGTKRYYNYTMKDSHEGGFGTISLQEVFEKSSNVGTSKVVVKHYSKQPQKFIDRLYAFGVNEPLNLDIPGESKPWVKDTKSKYWSGLSLPLMSIGYEEKITPLQTLTFYNAVANNGKMVKPQFVEEVKRGKRVVKPFEVQVIRERICSEKTIRIAKAMLEGVVQNGTATYLRNAPYQIAAKTGTAQIAQGKDGYKLKNKITYQASLCGYFPAKDPLYSIVVVVVGPGKRLYYGNDIAGPVFREIADKVYSMSSSFHKPLERDTLPVISFLPELVKGRSSEVSFICKQLNLQGIAVRDEKSYASFRVQDNRFTMLPFDIKPGVMPDLKGMTLKDAIPLLEERNIRVRATGRGRVVRQSLQPGTSIENGTEVLLELSPS